MVKLRNRGFTIIEIIIVVAIIGILAAVAIPQFSAYRKKSFNSKAMADLRNAATAQEAYHAEFVTYAGSLATLTIKPDFVPSPGVTLLVAGDAHGYTMTTYHPSGDKTFILRGPGGIISE